MRALLAIWTALTLAVAGGCAGSDHRDGVYATVAVEGTHAAVWMAQ